jgi:hypothetical protein
MFQARYYKDFAPTERAWPPANVPERAWPRANVQTAEAGAKRCFCLA